ncbi:cysteine desulfurase [Algibacter lectus]|uniref:Cysteine desulfurase n=1 Tax=Algibacter lectus TaxID=221126 RepID=A0A090X7B4_9FLAO|nr:cysteine desulfurase [Algibacter lectus]
MLNVDELTSKSIELKIMEGCLIERPGWIRMSIHPTMTNAEVEFVCDAIKAVAANYNVWNKDYDYNVSKNEFVHKDGISLEKQIITNWFKI